MNTAGFRRQGSHFLRSSRVRRKRDSDIEAIEFEPERDSLENLREILYHLAKQDVTSNRKLAYLNCFVKFNAKLTGDVGTISIDVIICSLRSCLLHSCSIVRAASLRVLRHYLDRVDRLKAFYYYKLDLLVVRCLDLFSSNETERNQAVRLCRHLLHIDPPSLKPSLVLPFVAMVFDGVPDKERLVLVSCEYLCELAYLNPELMAQCGALPVIMQYIFECHEDGCRLNEALIQTVLYLLNNPSTRKLVFRQVSLDQLLAPFTDCHYRHRNDSSDLNLRKEEREKRCSASLQALVTALHSWPGLVTLGHPQGTALSSLISSLHVSTCSSQQAVLRLLFCVFLLKIPVWTYDFKEALTSCDPCSASTSWSLREGFVAAESFLIYQSCCNRPNLIDNYSAVLLTLFIHHQLLESLCDVAIKGEARISIWATILLGELLYMSYQLLPWTDVDKTHFLPTLLTAAHSVNSTSEQRLQALQAVEFLDKHHTQKKEPKEPKSLHLKLLASFASGQETSRRTMNYRDRLMRCVPKESEEILMSSIKNSLVLVSSKWQQWDWNIIRAVLRADMDTLRRLDELTLHRFLAKVLDVFNPTTEDGYCAVKLSDEAARLYTTVGCLLMDKMVDLHQEEPKRYVREFLNHLCQCIVEIRQELPVQNAKLGLNNIFSNCCQDYFLFIGKLSHSVEGMALLETSGIMQQLLDLVTITSHDAYVKLIISNLDYSRDGACRVILSKALTATSENARLYAADFMRTLLRLKVPFFSSWCMELLVTQLYDQSRVVALRALSVIDEACEDKTNLLRLIEMRPSFLHLGEFGHLVVTRYLSVYEGYKFLKSSGYLDRELSRWHETYNVRYVEYVESMLSEALTTYEKSYDGSPVRRGSAARVRNRQLLVPPHLYGQIVQHSEGAECLASHRSVLELIHLLRAGSALDTTDIKRAKAAIWAVGHIGSSVWGLPILEESHIILSLVDIAERAQTLSLRGTAFYALCLIGSTAPGALHLNECGWRCVMRDRSQQWPVRHDGLMTPDSELMKDMRSMSQTSSGSYSSGNSHHDSSYLDLTAEDVVSKDEDEGVARSRASTEEALNFMADGPRRVFLLGADSPRQQPIKKDSKAHSTSELQIHPPNSHKRTSSDSLTSWRPGDILHDDSEKEERCRPTWIAQEDAGKHKEQPPSFTLPDMSINSFIASPSATEGPSNPHVGATDSSGYTANHSSGPSLLKVIPKPRSLSWRSDVVDRSKDSNMLSNSFLSHSSADSALSRSPQTDLVTDDPIVVSGSASGVPAYAGTPRKRLTSLSSENASPTPSSPLALVRPSFFTRKNELGLITFRALKRSPTPTDPKTSSVFSPSAVSKSFNVLRLLSHAGDLDTLSTAGRAGLAGNAYSGPRYIGLAMPADINLLFKVQDEPIVNWYTGSADPATTDADPATTDADPATTDADPVTADAGHGLELHSQFNCLFCIRLSSSTTKCSREGQGGGHGDLWSEKQVIVSEGDGHIVTCGDGLFAPEGDQQNLTTASDVEEITERNTNAQRLGSQALLRKECIKLIMTICSSIGVTAAESGLLRLREEFPGAFQDVCLYSEVLLLLSTYTFHLSSRKFIQELFLDISFDQVFRDTETALQIIPRGHECCEKHTRDS